MCASDEWPKQWQRVVKHRQANAAKWASSQARTWSEGPYGAAQYDPGRYGTDPAVEELELGCVEHGKLLSDTGKRRTYYRKMDHTVGVCSGEPTEYVFAEWLMSGEIHGRPISKSLLQTKYREEL